MPILSMRTSMSRNQEQPVKYTRQDLRKATKFVEGDYNGINPRQFYRSLKRSLEEIQEGADFKYMTAGSQDSSLSIESEQVGEKTGRVQGRLVASSHPREVGVGQIEYKPYGPHGALGLVLGGLILLIGLANGGAGLPIAGVLGLVVGGYFYFQTETGEFAVEREDVIRVLMTGEVSERTIEEGDETRTDIFANMSVIYAGDAFLSIPMSELEEMDWTLRREIANQVKRWYNRLVVEEGDKLEVDEGFVAELSAFSNRSLEGDRGTISEVQNVINGNFEKRIEYTEILMDRLPNHVRDELSDHQDSLLEELEELSEDMEVYVEREGLERV
jgi:hypothetical protein